MLFGNIDNIADQLVSVNYQSYILFYKILKEPSDGYNSHVEMFAKV